MSEVLSYQGLGELGPTVLLAAHDLVHPSEESGLVGQLLSLVRTYEDALGPDEGALPHAEAIERTLASPPAGVEAPLASMFAAWQGKQPLGSLLELDEGQVALVFGPSEHVAGSSRVASLEESGELGPLVDLGDSSAPSVRQAVSPVRLELDLTQLRSGS